MAQWEDPMSDISYGSTGSKRSETTRQAAGKHTPCYNGSSHCLLASPSPGSASEGCCVAEYTSDRIKDAEKGDICFYSSVYPTLLSQACFLNWISGCTGSHRCLNRCSRLTVKPLTISKSLI